jgi:hypothetical protein
VINWNLILDEGALITVLPGRYAKFARPVREALIQFLEGLPAEYQAEIIERQSWLPLSASIRAERPDAACLPADRISSAGHLSRLPPLVAAWRALRASATTTR